MKSNLNEICIINREDLVQYFGGQLDRVAEVVESVNFLYSIKKKSIHVIDVMSQNDSKCEDYYFDGREGLWILYNKIQYNIRESFLLAYEKACGLVSKCLNYSDVQKDALVIARAFVNQSATGVSSFLDERCFPEIVFDRNNYVNRCFQPILDPIGFYQIVPDLYWLKYVISLGVKVVQLRIKNKSIEEIENEIKESVEIANQNNVKLFINDYWQFAIKYKAYGVHLGQEDLKSANFNEIFHAGLRIGISTHCYYELAIAKYLNPSYIAFGPIFHTQLKSMDFIPQGIDLLNYWVKHLNFKIVAIGGIDLLNLDSVISTGVNGIAVVSAVINSEFPDKATSEFLAKCKIMS